ncbi:MAG: NnrU family protein [Pseudomonadales bacterium]
MALNIVILGITLFVLAHFIPVFPAWRAAIVKIVGANVYKLTFSLIAAAGFFGAIVAYRYTPHTPVWTPSLALRGVTIVLMFLSLLCFVGSANTPWFSRVVRHPMLWGIMLLGIAHLFANGEIAGVVLFGELAVFGLLWQFLTDRRDALVDAEKFATKKQTTSLLPFAKWNALGRDAPPVTLKPVLIAAFAFFVILFMHPYLFGVSVIAF